MKLSQLIKELEKKRQKYGDDIRVIRLDPDDKFLQKKFPNSSSEYWYYVIKPRVSEEYTHNGKSIGKVIVL